VTGGGAGIGLACARVLVEEGFRVAVCGRREGPLRAAAAELGDAASAHVCDVADEAALRDLIDGLAATHGGLHAVVANAGIDGAWGKLETLTAADLRATFEINLVGVHTTVAASLPHLRATGGIAVVIASLAGKVGARRAGAYGASKWGAIGLAHAVLAEAAGDGVRACAICPALVDTAMTEGSKVPRGEMLVPEDVAETLRFLLRLSPQAVVREVVLERLGIVRGDLSAF
jgi:NAD(P)-dependent dehydrogenase (short-subunit alcohol dehydrogenase family)